MFGEVGLGGEIRSVNGVEKRLAEAANLGFKHAFVPESTPQLDTKIHIERTYDVFDAAGQLGLLGAPSRKSTS